MFTDQRAQSKLWQAFLVEIDKLMSKCIWKGKRSRIAKTILKKQS